MSGERDDSPTPMERTKFEWRPEDITIIEPGDPDYDDGEFDTSEKENQDTSEDENQNDA
jgi:hypothetical protein